MRIESNWDECFIYLVVLEFPAPTLNKRRQSTRNFVMRDELTFSQFSRLVKYTFGKEVDVITVDVWGEGNLCKGRETAHEVN